MHGSAAEWPRSGLKCGPWSRASRPDLVVGECASSHSGSYRAAVVPFIADRCLSSALPGSRAREEASAEIARFDAELGAEVAPFASVLAPLRVGFVVDDREPDARRKAIALAELGSREKRNATRSSPTSPRCGGARAGRPARRRCDPRDARGAARRPAPGDRRTVARGAGLDRRDLFGPHEADFVPPHHDTFPR